MANTTSLDQEMTIVANKEFEGWVAVGIAEKVHDSSWGKEGRCFLVALREQKNAHLPFPGDPDESVPNKMLCFLWQSDKDFTVKNYEVIRDYSGNPDHPSINECMDALKKAVAAELQEKIALLNQQKIRAQVADYNVTSRATAENLKKQTVAHQEFEETLRLLADKGYRVGFRLIYDKEDNVYRIATQTSFL